ncbi:hypothetical protein UFOVP1228_9 [uncultured Caudovirales phage]|uniref:Uncharacterized protein n=1 Tax=uncultured Caudovirales phage TaxID=2100421 RepID=A0A6J5SL83_9CAUD|nr:hypothetical protein UFOVP956_9 [uncultured Caudovirales phage]CAB4191109.1 hypothetical protein UFOVP1228_9 [uncultured Caudovirales phage]CAB4215489.1 hypothetical protein UFOVP1481_29 [uncultured Caudovirales phage]
MIKSKLEGKAEFRASPKAELALAEVRKDEQESTLREELDSIKESVLRVERMLKDIDLILRLPHRQW